MFKNIFLKTLRDKRRSILGWSLGSLLYALVIVSFYPIFTQEKEAVFQYIRIFQEMPIIKFFGFNVEDLISLEGFLNTEFFYIMTPIIVIILAISLGSDVIAGEEERKTMDLLLSNSISRKKIVLEKFLAMTFILLIVGFSTYIGFLTSIFIYDVKISLLRLLQSVIMFGILGLSFGSLSFALGCATGSKGKSIAISAVIAIVSYLINALSNMVSIIERYRFLSLFYYYAGDNPLKKGIYFPHEYLFFLLKEETLKFS